MDTIKSEIEMNSNNGHSMEGLKKITELQAEIDSLKILREKDQAMMGQMDDLRSENKVLRNSVEVNLERIEKLEEQYERTKEELAMAQRCLEMERSGKISEGAVETPFPAEYYAEALAKMTANAMELMIAIESLRKSIEGFRQGSGGA